MERALQDLALAQGGVFATRQATARGESDESLAVMRKAGEVIRVRQGAYVLGPAWAAANPEGRLALRTRAVMSGLASHVGASHQSSLAVMGLPLLGVPMDEVDLVDRVERCRKRAAVRRHPLTGVPVATVDGVQAVDVPHALGQVAARHGAAAAVVSADAAVHRGLCTADQIAAMAEDWSGRNPPRVHRLPGLVDGRSESPGETRTRLLMWSLGFEPESQVVIEDGNGFFVARVDFLLQGKVVVEFDGQVKYGAGEDVRATVMAEKAREDRLRALGYVVVRLVWDDLQNPQSVARRIRAALAAARV